jgi:hypothetical protein
MNRYFKKTTTGFFIQNKSKHFIIDKETFTAHPSIYKAFLFPIVDYREWEENIENRKLPHEYEPYTLLKANKSVIIETDEMIG